MGYSIVLALELVEALLGYLFREHLLVNLHNNLMMHIPGMSKCIVRDPYGQGTLGFVIVQGYSWLVRTLSHGLWLGATAVVWRVASAVVFLVSMCVVPLFSTRS